MDYIFLLEAEVDSRTTLYNNAKELYLSTRNKTKQLEENWNELKQWLISNDVYYPEAILFRETLHKMRELEGGSNE